MSSNNSDSLAGLCSFLCPGLGQLVTGRPLQGIFWFLVVIFGYFCLFIPGLILHILCIVDASKS